MPKRPRHRSRTSSQASCESGHTPKWTRSSASLSPEPSNIQSLEDETTNTQEMRCILPGHPSLILATVAEFESHYASDHTNQCIACKANLPSPWMLELHHLEKHDPLVAAKRDGGEKTYQCFLQDCEKVTLTAQKRRLHLIDKHGFPRNYHFSIIDSGLKGRASLLQETKASTKTSKGNPSSETSDKPRHVSNQQANTDAQSISHGKQVQKDTSKPSTSSSESASVPTKQQGKAPSQDNTSVDNLSNAMSSLMFVPMSVRRKTKKNS